MRIPFPFDLTMRPIKYVEAADLGTFVAGATEYDASDPSFTSGVVLRSEMLSSSELTEWSEAATLTGHEIIVIMCGAFGMAGGNPALGIPDQPTYCVGTLAVDLSVSTVQFATIETSNDGLTWANSHDEFYGYTEAMAFDPTTKTFYAQINSYADLTRPPDHVCLASTNGREWSEVGRVMAELTFASPQLVATGHPDIVDGQGHVMPYGGMFGWKDKGGLETVIAPRRTDSYGWGITGLPDYDGSNVVDIIKKRINPETGLVETIRSTSVVPIDHVYAVAEAGGIWQACGINGDDTTSVVGAIALSADNGATWRVAYTGQKWILCMMAGLPPPATL